MSWSRNAQSNGLNPIVPDIATRNLRLSKLGRGCGPKPTVRSPADHLWLRNNNERESANSGDHDRLTLRKNWAQIGAGRSDFTIFRCAFFRNDIDARLFKASAFQENHRQPRARGSHRRGFRARLDAGIDLRPSPGSANAD